MSDARRRGRERAALDDAGDEAARARALTERIRAGALAPARLRLAASLGDPASRAALGAAAPPPLSIVPPHGFDPPSDPERAPAWLAMRIVDHWLATWAALGPDTAGDVLVVAALAVGRRALERLAPPPDARARLAAALDATAAWLERPDDEGRARCVRSARRAWPAAPLDALVGDLLHAHPPGVPEALPERLVFLPAVLPLLGPVSRERREHIIGRWLDDAVLAWGTAAVRDAIAAGVVPWALR